MVSLAVANLAVGATTTMEDVMTAFVGAVDANPVKEHVALVVSEESALVSAVFAGPGAQIRRSDEGLQATAAELSWFSRCFTFILI